MLLDRICNGQFIIKWAIWVIRMYFYYKLVGLLCFLAEAGCYIELILQFSFDALFLP